jgi:hypothetical protein
MQITVIGKANLGFSPKFGEIIAGQEYTIEEADFADQLFTRKPPEKQTKTEVLK